MTGFEEALTKASNHMHHVDNEAQKFIFAAMSGYSIHLHSTVNHSSMLFKRLSKILKDFLSIWKDEHKNEKTFEIEIFLFFFSPFVISVTYNHRFIFARVL